MTKTYLARAALDELDHAQEVVDRHLVACTVCGTNKPCGERRDAEAVFLRKGQLPRRTPGLAGGSAQTPTEFVWLGQSTATPGAA